MAALDWSQCPAVESIPGKVAQAFLPVLPQATIQTEGRLANCKMIPWNLSF